MVQELDDDLGKMTGKSLSGGQPREDVHRIQVGGRAIILVGTAHVSEASADLVSSVIESERPDAVCVELCAERYAAIRLHGLSDELNVRGFLNNGGRSAFLGLLYWYFQKEVGQKLGVKPGTEILRAIEAARSAGARIHPIDRDARITLSRAWGLLGLRAKLRLIFEFVLSFGSINQIKQEDIESYKRGDMLERSIEELGRSLPVVSRVLIDERDEYMTSRIREVEGGKILVVVGAAHVPGILRNLETVDSALCPSREAVQESE